MQNPSLILLYLLLQLPLGLVLGQLLARTGEVAE